MSPLRRFDFFKAIVPEHKEGSIIGSILTLTLIVFTFGFIYKETKIYRSQRLYTNLEINKTQHHEIHIHLDIEFPKLECDTLQYQLTFALKKSLTKKKLSQGCRVIGEISSDSTSFELRFFNDI